MTTALKAKRYWILLALLFAGISYSALGLTIIDNRPVDGPLEIGFPFVFYKKDVFPPNEQFNVINFMIDLSGYFLISLGIAHLIRAFIASIKNSKQNDAAF